jgi:hypothetical protein
MKAKLDNNIYRPIPPLLRGGKGVYNQGVTISKANTPPYPLLIEGEQIIDNYLIDIIIIQYYFHYSSNISSEKEVERFSSNNITLVIINDVISYALSIISIN